MSGQTDDRVKDWLVGLWLTLGSFTIMAVTTLLLSA